MFEEITIDKLVHGGQAIGTMADGRKVFVWNALPGEKVRVRITKNRKDYAEGIAEEIIEASTERVEPVDEAYLSTSPWQILAFDSENTYKQQILAETMQREKVVWDKEIPLHADSRQWHYRNKMEYSFWADDEGLHLALFHRGSHGKRIVPGSNIARPEIDGTASKILNLLNEKDIRGSQLKTIVVRCNQLGESVVALFVKDEEFPKLKELEGLAKGVAVCYSNPKSPASVLTKLLYTYGDTTLRDTVMGVDISYGVHSFFQVNLPVFELALKRIDYFTGGANNKVDLYCGVGTIGVPIGGTKTYVDIDPINCEFARKNVGGSGEVIQASSEQALQYITSDCTLVVDPPRAGLHTKLVEKIKEVPPKQLVYLSCNPSTQARDLALLQDAYTIEAIEGYNFFPRTPHIESLAILKRKAK